MSSNCLLFRTYFMTGRLKLLIVKTCATVSDERQGWPGSTHPNNKVQQSKAKADSQLWRKRVNCFALNFRRERCPILKRVKDQAARNHAGAY
jgi:hypothetical protein